LTMAALALIHKQFIRVVAFALASTVLLMVWSETLLMQGNVGGMQPRTILIHQQPITPTPQQTTAALSTSSGPNVINADTDIAAQQENKVHDQDQDVPKPATGSKEVDFDLTNDQEYVKAIILHHAATKDYPTLPVSRRGKLQCNQFYGSGNITTSDGDTFVAAQNDLIYWQNIPEDDLIQSPFLPKDGRLPQYLTFDIDLGGWNNRRLSFETMVAYAIAMGRILVLPPPTMLHHPVITQDKDHRGQAQKVSFGFEDVFQSLEDIPQLPGVISMQEFLEQVAMQGKLKDANGQVTYPPNNRTNWVVNMRQDLQPLMDWFQTSTTQLDWNPEHCFGAFPKSSSSNDVTYLEQVHDNLNVSDLNSFVGNPVPVNGTVEERMLEYKGGRSKICTYNSYYQNTQFLHVSEKYRTLLPFYSMTFFQDWRYDLWLKRVMRDQVRYNDEIFCAAAHAVAHVKKQALLQDPSNTHGIYDAMHIRQALEFRHMFQFDNFTSDATIYKESQMVVPENSTVFVATDAKDPHFFDLMRGHYNLIFLSDCLAILAGTGLNTNLYGLVDQLVASVGRFFFASWYSTFGSYIARLQGYHMAQEHAPGVKEGSIATWPYIYPDPADFSYMRRYHPLVKPLWKREFPTCWRELDMGMADFHHEVKSRAR
jgi:GDP-fucose protein O-fucosyltransferase